jgi:hypothetical protein
VDAPTSLAVSADQIGPPLARAVAWRLERLASDLERVSVDDTRSGGPSGVRLGLEPPAPSRAAS